MSMEPKEAVALTCMAAFFIAPWFIAGLNLWGWCFVAIMAVVLLCELIGTLKYDKTISRMFWEYRAGHKAAGNAILACLSVGWLILVLHLLRIP